MANVLPAISTQGEPIADVFVEQRDILVRVEGVVERSFSKLDIIEDVMKSTLDVQEAQSNALRLQAENAEFAADEAAREAARRAQIDRQDSAQATAKPAGDANGGLGSFASGLAGGLAAGGVASTLRLLAGRLITGGGLAAVGIYFGEEIGKFLSTEADSFLNDVGISDQIKDNITTALRDNTDEALIFGGISKLIFGRTLPGIIAGFVLGSLDIEKLFSDDPEVRKEFYDNLGNELSSGWDELVKDRPVSTILTGAGVGALALFTKGPLVKRIAVSLIGAYGLSNLLPGDEDIDNLNTKITNQVVDELTLMGFGEEGAQTAVDIGGAAISGLSAGWLAGLINKRLKIPAMIAGFIWDFYDLNRIFTPEGRESLLDSAEQTVRRILQGEGMTDDYIDAAVAGLGIGGTLFAADRARRRFGNRPSATGGAAAPEAVVEDRAQLRNRVTGYSESQLERAGVRQTSPGSFQRIVDGRPTGSFMSYADVDDQVRQSRIRSKFPRMSGRMFGALLGAGLSAAEIYLILEDPNTTPQEKAQQMGGVAVGFLGGAAVGALIGFVASWYTGPGAIVITGLASLAGYAFGDWMATAFFEWMLEARSDSELENMNGQATAGIAGISSQADVDAYLREFGITPTTPSTPVQGGRGRTVEAPGARALAGQIAGVQTQLEAAQSERAEASNRAARRDANQNVIRLERALEDLEEQLEELNQSFKNSTATLSDASFNNATGGARVYNAALGTGMNTGARTMQAALTPSFGQPRLMRASLSTQGSSTPSEQSFPIPLTGGASSRGAESSLVFQPAFGNALMSMYNDAPDYVQDGLRILSGYRSPEIQEQLYEDKLREVRAAHPDWNDTQIEREARRWVAPPGHSRHNTGQAVDLSYANNRVKQWVHDNAGRYGLHFPLANEDWHIEMAGLGGSRVAMIDTPPVSFANGVPSQTPDRQIAEAPTARTPLPNMPGGDIEAGRSMLGTFSQSIQSLGGFGFDALFGEGAFSQIIGSTNPEQMIANKLDRVFKNVGVSPEAIELNRGSETATQAAPIVVNAPQINNDNSVQASGGGGRERASQQVAIAPVGEQSATSTMRDWIDATFA
jgi:hypothetical protein